MLRKVTLWGALVLLLVGCAPDPALALTAIPTHEFPTATEAPPPTQTPTTAPTATITPTATATPRPIDYGVLQASLARYAQEQAAQGIDLGIAFVDVQSGHVASVRGEERFYSLSTFKAPLAAYYLWLLERGEIEELPADATYLSIMLNRSDNPATTCIVERVGGLAPFNDWLAGQGLPREGNFVTAWQSWLCPATEHLPDVDLRYLNGDAALGLPGGGSLLVCAGVRCDKAFTPEALAGFYTRLHAGDVIGPGALGRWYAWMEKTPEGTFFEDGLPPGALVTAYTKNGFRQADALYDRNFYHEAGLVRTPYGDYVLVVFMQGNPSWPGGDVLAEVGRLAFTEFVANYAP